MHLSFSEYNTFVRRLISLKSHHESAKITVQFVRNRDRDLQNTLQDLQLKENWKSYKIELSIRNNSDVNIKVNFQDGLKIASEASEASEVPYSIDWRLKGAVTDVKDVGKCNGGSWSFAATGALEGQQFLANGKLVPLSAQNLIDCVSFVDVEGCENGYADMAYWYIKQNGGIDTEESYPFEGEWKGKCRFDNKSVGASVAEEEVLKRIVAKTGPVSVI